MMTIWERISILLIGLVLASGCGGRNLSGIQVPDDVDPTKIPTQAVAVQDKVVPADIEIQKTEEPLTHDVVLIPEGRFVMGAEAEKGFAICQESRPGCELDDFADETPVREVFLDAYWIDKYEVTNSDYRHCVEAGGCQLPVLLEFYDYPDFSNHPVVYVSWFQADAYCQWVGGWLPSEAQWEKASRGPDERLFPWGDEISCGKANLKGCTEGLTMRVGSFPDGASPYGVMDMAGNAAEWVADWYAPLGYSIEDISNPKGPQEGELRVARGGSWKNPFSGVRVTNRTANYPEVFSSGVGFRCVYEQQP